MNNSLLAANNTLTLSLEAIGIMLGILVSVTILLGLLIQYANKINRIENDLRYLKQELLEHSNLDGHKVLTDKLNVCTESVRRAEQSLDLHIQDYINRKELVQFLLGQLDEKIQHKFNRTVGTINNIQKYLEKDGSYKIRDSLEDGK